MSPTPRHRRHKTRAGNPVLELPPADFDDIEPEFVPVVAGSGLQRVYSPEPYTTEALTFRTHGPHNRFDHHRRSADGKARVDAERGILYAGHGLACCLGEFFADSTEITLPGTRVATISPTTDLTLLDLRKTAALGASTTQAIAAISERKTTQAWSRWWYEHPQLVDIHGLLYTASNTGHDAVALYERAAGKLEVRVDLDVGDASLDVELQLAAAQLRWPLAR